MYKCRQQMANVQRRISMQNVPKEFIPLQPIRKQAFISSDDFKHKINLLLNINTINVAFYDFTQVLINTPTRNTYEIVHAHE